MSNLISLDPGVIWTCAWQSGACLAAGLAASALAPRPARGHCLLLLGIAAAATAPLLTISAKRFGWGLLAPQPSLAAKPTVQNTDRASRVALSAEPEFNSAWESPAEAVVADAGA